MNHSALEIIIIYASSRRRTPVLAPNMMYVGIRVLRWTSGQSLHQSPHAEIRQPHDIDQTTKQERSDRVYRVIVNRECLVARSQPAPPQPHAAGLLPLHRQGLPGRPGHYLDSHFGSAQAPQRRWRSGSHGGSLALK